VNVRAAARPAGHASHCPDAIRNYSADAGAGSQIITNISESPGWRAALLGTVAAGSLWLYSARSARAACVNSGGSTYSCSGANTTQQTINANNAAVSTVPGFSVITTDPRAVSIARDGALSFIDINDSTLTAANTALYVRSGGDIPAGNQGSVTIDTNGRDRRLSRH
jgi:hypothetical protein